MSGYEIRCPGCGRIMMNSEPQIYTGVLGYARKSPFTYISSFSCSCGWTAPIGFGETPAESTRDAAEKAKARSRQQKPLRLKDLGLYEDRPVFIESGRRRNKSSPVKIDTFKWVLLRWFGCESSPYISFVTTCLPDNDGCYEFSLRRKDYGRTWRCWASRPTDDEREAAVFDE